MNKPQIYEFFHKKKQEIDEESKQQIEKVKKEANIYYNEWKDLGDQFERQKKDYFNVINVKDDYVFANGKLKEQIKEMQSKIISLENRLSSTVTEKKKAVYNPLICEIKLNSNKYYMKYINILFIINVSAPAGT